MGWTFISKKDIIKRPFTHVEEWTMQTPDGDEVKADINVFADAVFVCGITEDNQVLLIKEYFISNQEKVLGVVAGYVDEGEGFLEAAKRELLEETGCTANEWIETGSIIRNKWGTGKFHFYLAKGIVQSGEQQLDHAEDIDVHFVSLEECKQLLKEGKIHDISGALCVHRALDYLE